MTYSEEKPTENGYYWYKFSKDSKAIPEIVYIYDGKLWFIEEIDEYYIEEVSGYFYGPIKEPIEIQECSDDVLDILNK